MKKYLLLILLFIIFTTANGKSISLNLGMSDVGDSIRYRIVIKNDSNDDYLLDKNSVKVSSDYIDYTIESSDNSNIIKAKTAKAVYLNVQYKYQVPDSAYQNGVFNDKVNMKVNLSSSGIGNPDTGIEYYIFFALVILINIIMFIIFKRKRKIQSAFFIIEVSLLIPMGVYALCRCDISVNSTVVINQTDSCKYRLITDYGSFSLTEDVKETCITTYDDDYIYHYNDIDIVDEYDSSVGLERAMSYFYISELGPADLKENSYIKIYEDETKQNLIKTITKNDFNYKEKYSITELKYTYDHDYSKIVVPLGVYDYKNIYMELSDDLLPEFTVNCHEYFNNNDYHKCTTRTYTIFHDSIYSKIVLTDETVEGPWIKGKKTFDLLDILNETLQIEANNRGQDYKISITKEGNNLYVHTEFYTMIFH